VQMYVLPCVWKICIFVIVSCMSSFLYFNIGFCTCCIDMYCDDTIYKCILCRCVQSVPKVYTLKATASNALLARMTYISAQSDADFAVMCSGISLQQSVTM